MRPDTCLVYTAISKRQQTRIATKKLSAGYKEKALDMKVIKYRNSFSRRLWSIHPLRFPEVILI